MHPVLIICWRSAGSQTFHTRLFTVLNCNAWSVAMRWLCVDKVSLPIAISARPHARILGNDLLLLGDITCIPFFCRYNQTTLSLELWSAQRIAPFWPHRWLPLLPLWRVDESRPHKEWPELPTVRWGEAVQSRSLHSSDCIKYDCVIIQLLLSYVTTVCIGFLCKVYTVSCHVNLLCMIHCFNSHNYAIR